MANEALSFDLDLTISKAERQFKEFIKSSEAEMKRLKKEFENTFASAAKKQSRNKGGFYRQQDTEKDKLSARMAARAMEKEWTTAIARVEQFSKRHPLVSRTEIDKALQQIQRLRNTPVAQRRDYARGRTAGILGDLSAKGDAANSLAAQAKTVANENKKVASSTRQIEKAWDNVGRAIDRAAKKAGQLGKKEAADVRKELATVRGMSQNQNRDAALTYRDYAVDRIRGVGPSQVNEDRERDRQMRNGERKREALIQAEQNAQAAITRAALLGEEERVRLAQDASARIAAIRAKSSAMSVRQLSGALQLGHSQTQADIKSAVMAAQAQEQRKLHNVTRMNKINMGAFQAQQIVEDFQFAGMRGASNNIAMLAASIGGPAGLAAMAAVAVVALGPLALKMIGLKGPAQVAGAEFKQLTMRLKHLREQAQETLQLVGEADFFKDGSDSFSAQADEAARAWERQRESAASFREELIRLEAVERARKAAQQQFWDDVSGADGHMGKDALGPLNEALNKAGIAGTTWSGDLDKMLLGFGMDPFTDFTKSLDEAREGLSASNAELDKLSNKEQTFKRLAENASEFAEAFRNIRRRREDTDDIGLTSGKPDPVSDHQAAAEKRLRRYREDAREAMGIGGLERQMQGAQNAEAVALNDGDMEEANRQRERWIELLDQIEEKERRLEALIKARTGAEQIALDEVIRQEEERSALVDEIKDKLGETTSELESHADALRELIKLDRERVALREREKLASKESFADKKHEAEQDRISLQADKHREGISKAADAQRDKLENFENNISRQAEMRRRWIDGQVNAHGNTSQAQRHGAYLHKEVDAWERAWHEAAERKGKRIDRQEKVRLEKTKEREKELIESGLDKREQMLQERVQTGMTKGRTEAVLQGRNSERSEYWYDQAQQAAEELRDLQLGRYAEQGDPAMKRAEKTQTDLDKIFTEKDEADEWSDMDHQQEFHDTERKLETLQGIKEQIESTKFVSEADKSDMQQMLEQMKQIAEWKKNAARWGETPESPAPWDQIPPARAAGGPVTSGNPYLVGERGPEFFVPGSSGSILSTKDSRSLMGLVAQAVQYAGNDGASAITNHTTNFGTVNVNANGGPDLRQVALQAAFQAKSAKIRRNGV